MAKKTTENKIEAKSKDTKINSKNVKEVSSKKAGLTKQEKPVDLPAILQQDKPNDNDPVTFGRFRSGYKVLSMLIGLLAVLFVFNLILIFFLAWVVGYQLDRDVEGSYGETLVNVEEKVDAVIEALPAQFRPKLDLDVVRPSAEIDRWKGDKDNRYVWIKYSDLECPYCSSIQPELNDFIEDSSDEVSLVFRNFPLNNIHPNAQKLAETAECVAEYNGEGAFWDFVERSYSMEIPATVSGEEELSQFVENSSQVASCVESGQAEEKVQRDVDDALKATVSGTPTFIIYDMETDETKFVTNPVSSERMKSVQEEFAEKQEG